MSRVEALYRWLSRERGPDVDRAFVAGLAHAEPPYDAEIVRILLRRPNEIAWGGLVAHYPLLDAATRQQMLGKPELLRAATAAALTAASEDGRAAALELLTDHPCPALSYHVADALRDPAPGVRAAAARVLCRTGERLWSDGEGSPRGPEAATERGNYIEALRQALRTFDLHQRPDVLEVCLWFAPELGDGLWDTLNAPRSAAGHVVARHLPAWNGPRLAGFLLLALGQPAWQRSAQRLLEGWSSRDEVIALLRRTDLLRDPRVRGHLHLLHRPRWLVMHGAALIDLPRDVRSKAPQWVCHLGFTAEARLRYLMIWQASPMPELHRAAVYALAHLGTPEAARVLAEVAARPGPMSRFARWFLAGAATRGAASASRSTVTAGRGAEGRR